uniref:Cytoplasmic polyadenylation element-binding protein 2 n=1 Tax=Sipha flava TaxID=143950 RepID=A0A2S2QV29_9HEMI
MNMFRAYHQGTTAAAAAPSMDSGANRNLVPVSGDLSLVYPHATAPWNFNMFQRGFINSNTLHSLAHLHGKSPFFQSLEDQTGLLDDSSSNLIDTSVQALTSPSRSSPHSQGSESSERFSRKVFVGGLPPDIDEDEITASFRRFGQLVVDWPHKAESKSYFPPKGYAFLLFQVLFTDIKCGY